MSTGITSLDSSLTTTSEWFNGIEEELKWPDKNRIYSATKAVLGTLRDCLTIEELHQFTAQLPMIWTGMLFEGYDPTGKPMRMNREEFLQSVRDKFGPNPINAEETTIAIAKVLKKKISKGQYEDVVGQLQDDVRTLFQ